MLILELFFLLGKLLGEDLNCRYEEGMVKNELITL